MRNIIFGIIFFSFFSAGELFAATHSVNILANVPGCGDAFIQTGEQCDTGNLGGSTCTSLGFSSGVLSCSSACTFITASCSLEPDTSSSGGTRVNRVSESNSQTNVVVFGQAAPFSAVSLLKDGQRTASVPVGADGMFQMTIAGVGSGSHRIMLVVERIGFSSEQTQSIPVQIVRDATTKIGPLLLPPLVRYTYSDGSLSVTGYAHPSQSVALLRNGAVVAYVPVAEDGLYQGVFSGSQGDIFSIALVLERDILVSTRPYVITSEVKVYQPCSVLGDINGDCQVGPVDFFITRYRYLEELLSSRFDFSKDGKVDIVDFSIMAFYWTG